MSNSRPREVLNAVHSVKEKGPPTADGTLSVTADASETTELCSRRSALDFIPTTSTYLEDDPSGAKPSELYGKVTWKIEHFSETSKRELRSNVFEVGQYKWYILVYPHGCDVCNHLSLFLCVADYDKLLPGWSHFAQFTIAVVNKDPKKSKYSDTLHRFCKKEHDWGWKKFMELTKVLDGFAVNDTLIIKAQVQVIKDHAERPFRCLDPYYRQELVRVYLSNVEGVFRRFIEKRREGLSALKNHSEAFTAFWKSLSKDMRKAIITETEDVILKELVKLFFNEKEVTSTLVMDAVFCGCKQIEEKSRQWLEGSRNRGSTPDVIINRKNGIFVLGGDVISVMESTACDHLCASGSDDKDAEAAAIRSSHCDESIKDSVVRDEHRLAELGRKAVEMFIVSHIFTEHIEIAYQEAECLKRQEELLREEEEDAKREQQRKTTKAQNEKQKKAKRLEKKKEKKAAERQKKENEEAEQHRREEERKKEAEKKRIEEQEQKRLLEEKMEREHQQALEEARLRAEQREREEAQKRAQLQSMPQSTIKTALVTETAPRQERSAQSESSKSASAIGPTERRTQTTSPGTRSTTERSIDTATKSMPQRPTHVVDPSAAITVKQREEIKKLHSKIHSLEKQLSDRDSLILQLQQENEQLKQRRKELEMELTNRPMTPQGLKLCTTRTNGVESPCTSQSETAKTDGSKGSKGMDYAPVGVRYRGPAPKSIALLQGIPPSKTPEGTEMAPHDARCHSSGDETCSETTLLDHSRCTSMNLNSVDHSQVSDCTTHETRSLSSFGTQLDPNGQETEAGMQHEGYRLGRGYEMAAGSGMEQQKPVPAPHVMHMHSHSLGIAQSATLPVSQVYVSQQHSASRANSVASCIPTRHHQHMNSHPALYAGGMVGRSYSVDASMRLPDSGPYATCPSYNEIAAMQDPFDLLCSSLQQGMVPESAFSQQEIPRMCDGLRPTECSSFDDFAHFSLIKDLLD